MSTERDKGEGFLGGRKLWDVIGTAASEGNRKKETNQAAGSWIRQRDRLQQRNSSAGFAQWKFSVLHFIIGEFPPKGHCVIPVQVKITEQGAAMSAGKHTEGCWLWVCHRLGLRCSIFIISNLKSLWDKLDIDVYSQGMEVSEESQVLPHYLPELGFCLCFDFF